MAYAFNKVDEYFRGGRAGTGAPTGGGAGAITKGPAIPGGSTRAQGGGLPTGQVGTGAQILEANKNFGGESVASKILAPAQQQVTNTANQQMQGAKDYLGGVQSDVASKFGAPSDLGGLVNKASLGDTDATSKLSQALTTQAYNPGTYNPGANPNISSANYARSGNVGSYLQQQSGGKRYTPGMGLLDQLAFNRSSGGQQVSKKLGELQQQSVQGRQAAENVAKGAEGLAEKQQTETQRMVREAIAAKEQALRDAINAGLAEQQQKAGLALTENQTAGQKSLQDILAGMPTTTTGSREAYAGIDPSKYLTLAETEQSYNPAELSQYNTLAALIGGESMQPGAYKTGTYNADVEGYRAALENAVKGLQTPAEQRNEIQEGPGTVTPKSGVPGGVQVPNPDGSTTQVPVDPNPWTPPVPPPPSQPEPNYSTPDEGGPEYSQPGDTSTVIPNRGGEYSPNVPDGSDRASPDMGGIETQPGYGGVAGGRSQTGSGKTYNVGESPFSEEDIGNVITGGAYGALFDTGGDIGGGYGGTGGYAGAGDVTFQNDGAVYGPGAMQAENGQLIYNTTPVGEHGALLGK